MTIKIPEKNLGDRILGILGKNRAIYLPNNITTNDVDAGHYVYAQAQKETFLKALLRPPNKPLADGLIYIDELEND